MKTSSRSFLAISIVATLAASFTSLAQAAPTRPAFVATTDARCATTKPLTLFNINDFHGRIEAAPWTFSPVETLRATQPGVGLFSAGDNIGASTFVAMMSDDMSTIDVLNAAGLQASAPGNHEFDGGWAKLRDKYLPAAKFPYVAANMTGVSPQIAPYTITVIDGVRVAVVGAELSTLSGSVSPVGIQGITVSSETTAVNSVADKIKAAKLADVVVAEVHNAVTSGYSASVDVIFNGHTHENYSVTTNLSQPVVQAASYGTALGRVDLKIGTDNVICGAPIGAVIPIPTSDKNKPLPTADTPTINKIKAIVAQAKSQADARGNEVIGDTCRPLQRALDAQGKENRAAESTLTDLVAQMFYERLSQGNPEFIGLQNPGGTRADLDKGDITYAEANAVLPFANTLMTTQVTGAQFKTVLEQQWQRLPNGSVPARPYLQLGISNNVTYTFDESLPEGSRITGIWINGKAMNPAAIYTVGSGSFLIAGGDNFFELGKGINRTDTGKSDLSEWVEWIKATDSARGNICPGSEKQAAAFTASTAAVSCTAPTSFTLGKPHNGGIQADTLDFPAPEPEDRTIKAFADGILLGEFPITKGTAIFSLQAPATSMGGDLSFITTNGTTISLAGKVTVERCAPLPVATANKPAPLLPHTGATT
ncbi:MAG: bifunctional metallophosphatase/5'-nucleotidase [Propionibacteriaceae bacterium]